MSICALCKKDRELEDSHVVPSFIFKWLKETSVTGFVRDVRDGNRRVQDGFKTPLLCKECELRFSKLESEFNLKIFQVFTRNFIDLSGRITSDGYLRYGEWLNRFAISIAWRSFVSDIFMEDSVGLSKPIQQSVDVLLEKWRLYLLGDSNDYGKATSYLLFLRNIHAGKGDLPEETSPKIVHYLMRSIDGALIFYEDDIIDMTKLGPIMLLTAIRPRKIIGFPNSAIGKTGKIKIEQVWSNGGLNSYLFITRPNEIDKLRTKTAKQQQQVNDALEKNRERISTTMTMSVIKADLDKN